MNLNISIGTRILAGFGVVLLVVGAVGAVAYHATTELIESAKLVSNSRSVREKITEILSRFKDAETGQRGFVLTGQERYLQPYTAAVRAIDGQIQELRELNYDRPVAQRQIDQLQPLIAGKFGELAETISLRRQKGEQAAVEVILTDRGKNDMDRIRSLMTQMDNSANEVLKERDLSARSTAAFATTVMTFGGLLALVLVLVVGMLIRYSITSQLTAFMQFASRVGAGDLTQQASTSRTDELGKLAVCLNQMVAGLRDVASQARSATQELNSAATEILASTQQQSAGTGEQAAAIQQTTTTMEEVAQSGVQISERAKEVTASAEAASAASQTGLQAVENTARTMETIREQAEAVAGNVVSLSERTQAISEIISTVNDLAEQSHLLALNAAIEAAAAGEHGRSFSVIAGEVKNLADQSREATVQVRAILSDIQKGINSSVMLSEEAVKRVESGTQQADIADRTIRQMTEGIQQSVQAFQQIVAGASQQQIGFVQVTQSVRDIGQASQQSASSTRQLEKEALRLTSLSQQLQKAVERYRI
jgi:methyl-accepting chemotaxis protein